MATRDSLGDIDDLTSGDDGKGGVGAGGPYGVNGGEEWLGFSGIWELVLSIHCVGPGT